MYSQRSRFQRHFSYELTLWYMVYNLDPTRNWAHYDVEWGLDRCDAGISLRQSVDLPSPGPFQTYALADPPYISGILSCTSAIHSILT